MAYLGTKPANQVIDSTLIADGTITPADLSTGKPVWDTSGKVGIGTDSPTFKLTVVDNSTGQQASINSSSSNGTSVGFTSTSTNGRTWRVGTNYVTGSGEFSIYDSTAAAERLVINSSGNVGIGTSSPSYKLHVVGGQTRLDVSSAGTSLVCLGTGSNFQVDHSTSGYATLINSANSGAAMIFKGSSESMRIDSSGNLLVNTTSQFGNGVLNINTYRGGAVTGLMTQPSTNANYDAAGFRNSSGSYVGYISCTASATSYVTSSDYRLKENIAPMTGALDKVSLLKPCTYTWKLTGEESQGFIAHELAEVVPDCVTGEKDAVETYTDEDGVEQTRPKYQGIDTSFLVATLTAAIQEQQAIITAQADTISAMEARLTALEAK